MRNKKEFHEGNQKELEEDFQEQLFQVAFLSTRRGSYHETKIKGTWFYYGAQNLYNTNWSSKYYQGLENCKNEPLDYFQKEFVLDTHKKNSWKVFRNNFWRSWKIIRINSEQMAWSDY